MSVKDENFPRAKGVFRGRHPSLFFVSFRASFAFSADRVCLPSYGAKRNKFGRSTPTGSHLGVGEFTTHFRLFLGAPPILEPILVVGLVDVHWLTGVLTHRQVSTVQFSSCQ